MDATVPAPSSIYSKLIGHFFDGVELTVGRGRLSVVQIPKFSLGPDEAALTWAYAHASDPPGICTVHPLPVFMLQAGVVRTRAGHLCGAPQRRQNVNQSILRRAAAVSRSLHV
jgi:hypothetical protein